jgi:hypothetical protein
VGTPAAGRRAGQTVRSASNRDDQTESSAALASNNTVAGFTRVAIATRNDHSLDER